MATKLLMLVVKAYHSQRTTSHRPTDLLCTKMYRKPKAHAVVARAESYKYKMLETANATATELRMRMINRENFETENYEATSLIFIYREQGRKICKRNRDEERKDD